MPEPKRWHVRITTRATADLIAICVFIDQSSPQNAASVAKEIIAAIDSLEIFPQRYKVHQFRRDAGVAVHSMPVMPFIIYYRISASSDVVEVLTVRHGHQRQPQRFD